MVDNDKISQQEGTEKGDIKVVNPIWNLPNVLTLSRIAIIPIFVALFYVEFTAHYFVVCGLFAVACITDFFDGAIARKRNIVTNFGKFLDPLADKVLVLTGYILFLTVPRIFCNYLGDWAIIVAGCGVATMFAREIIISGFRMVAASSGEVIAADMIGKYKTFMQDLSVGALLLGEGILQLGSRLGEVVNLIGKIANLVGVSLFVVSIILTVVSGINYIAKNIRVLK